MTDNQSDYLHKILIDTRKLVAEAAMSGFNCKDESQWADRLFANQAKLTEAIRKIEGKLEW